VYAFVFIGANSFTDLFWQKSTREL
jgi:hypothetical protein